jgi:hypothetical protein
MNEHLKYFFFLFEDVGFLVVFFHSRMRVYLRLLDQNKHFFYDDQSTNMERALNMGLQEH